MSEKVKKERNEIFGNFLGEGKKISFSIWKTKIVLGNTN